MPRGEVCRHELNDASVAIHPRRAISYILASSTPSPKGPLLRGAVDLLIHMNAAVEVAKLSDAPEDWAYAALCFDATVALEVLDPKTVDKAILKSLAKARARNSTAVVDALR